jgi:hypothetical protein
MGILSWLFGKKKSNVYDLTGLSWEQAKEYARKGFKVAWIEWPVGEYVRTCCPAHPDSIVKVSGLKINYLWQPTEAERLGCGWAVIK